MQKPKIGISVGDYNGVGIEVLLKSLLYPSSSAENILSKTNLIFYGPHTLLEYYAHLVGLDMPKYHYFQNNESFKGDAINIPYSFYDYVNKLEVAHGKIDPNTATLTMASLKQATDDAISSTTDAILTLPINKSILQNKGFNFPGHTEYLCERTNTGEVLMLMYSKKLKVGIVTGHIPVEKVSNTINQELLSKKINILGSGLQKLFGISNPKIAILGLNPHAGENGKLGIEEKELITPFIDNYQQENITLSGPFPADGFFGSRLYKSYDAVLAMYHDQGLIPFKMLAFDDGVNITFGLPIIRTSPAHGTAYDIVGTGKANFHSCFTALSLAYNLARK